MGAGFILTHQPAVAGDIAGRDRGEAACDGNIGPVSTLAFVTTVWMTVTTVAEILADRGVKLFIHPSHNIPGDTTAKERLDAALAEYKRRIAGV